MIPLFPLDLVLFPGATLPLHIFEPHYREMVSQCLSEKKHFGIVRSRPTETAVASGAPHALATTGCTAEIVTVLRLYDDGRSDILTEGRKRFEILQLSTGASFIQADVVYFDDVAEAASNAAVQEILGLNRELLNLTQTADPGFTTDQPELSFALAESLPLDLDFKQALLEMRSEAQRIDHLLEYYRKLLPQARLIKRARHTVPGNGYVM